MEVVNPKLAFTVFIGLLHNILKSEFVRNFLLETSSSSDLSILTSKNCIQHVVVGIENIGMPLRTAVFKINWMFIPAFCFNKYSALLFVKEGIVIRSTAAKWRVIMK